MERQMLPPPLATRASSRRRLAVALVFGAAAVIAAVTYLTWPKVRLTYCLHGKMSADRINHSSIVVRCVEDGR